MLGLIILIVTTSVTVSSSTEFQPYQVTALRIHNELRANHAQTEDLILNEHLTGMAEKCAKRYLDKGQMDRSCRHRDYPKKGNASESRFWHRKGRLNASLLAEAATRQWYKGVKQWDFKLGRVKNGAPKRYEFAQVVSRTTRWLGFGVAASREKGTFAVALYLEAFRGNWKPEVVKTLVSKPTKDVVDSRTVNEILGVAPFMADPFQNATLEEHNLYRKRHPGTPKMELDEELCELARKCVEWYQEKGLLDGSCEHKETSRGPAGENLFWLGDATVDPLKLAETAVREWYAEILNWNFDAGEPLEKLQSSGRFTQLVCRSSSRLGVGVVQNPENGTFLVALYLERVRDHWSRERMKQVVLPPGDPHFARNVKEGGIPFKGSEVEAWALEVQNRKRVGHWNTPKLSWDPELSLLAQRCAEWYLAKAGNCFKDQCPFKNSMARGEAGENRFWHVSGAAELSQIVEAAVAEWYAGIRFWDFEAAGPEKSFKKPREYLQLVCKTSTKVGVGWAQDPQNGTVLVALYLEPFKGYWKTEQLRQVVQAPKDAKVEDKPFEVDFEVKDFQAVALHEHNEHRARHPGTPEMSLDQELCLLATKCAEWYLQTGRFYGNCPHKNTRTRGVAGENFFWHFGTDHWPVWLVAESAVADWYWGLRKWDFDTGGPKKALRNPKQFSQLVCTICSKLGVGVAQHPEKGTYLVALYLPGLNRNWNREKMRTLVLAPGDPELEWSLTQVFVVEPLEYQRSGLEMHNDFRMLHPGTPPMVLKEGLNNMAQQCAEWAVLETGNCPYLRDHPVKGRPAVNVLCGENGSLVLEEDAVDAAVQEWYAEGQRWDWKRSRELEGQKRPSAFIRMIYKFSQWLGVGFARAGNGKSCVVAVYLDNPEASGSDWIALQPPRDKKAGKGNATRVEPYQQRALEVHNELRARHPGTPRMELRQGLNQKAVQCAEWYAGQARRFAKGACPFKTHTKKGAAGENVYFYAGRDLEVDGRVLVEVAIKEWYLRGMHGWDFAKGVAKEKHGQAEEFAQMMSKTAVELGVGVAQQKDRGGIVVMLYFERVHGWKPERYRDNLLAARDTHLLPVAMWTTPPKDFEARALQVHNELRAKHPGTPEMLLLESYSSVAQRCAQFYLDQDKWDRKCPFKTKWNPGHNGEKGGENFYWLAPGQVKDRVAAVEKAVRYWYAEGAFWDFKRASPKRTSSGDMPFPVLFAQMLVCQNGGLGVGVAEHKEKGTFVVAYYENDVERKTLGNVRRGTYWRDNLLPPEEPIGRATNGTGTRNKWTLKHYQVVGLRVHNELRLRHEKTPRMELDRELSQMAERCAEYYAKRDKLDHSCPFKDPDVGENLSRKTGIMPTEDEFVEASVRDWYGELKWHNFSLQSVGRRSQRFAQLVWTTSTQLGVGGAKWRGTFVVVGLYREQGHVGNISGTCVKPVKGELPRESPTTAAPTPEEDYVLAGDADEGAEALQVQDSGETENEVEAELEVATKASRSLEEEDQAEPGDYPETTPFASGEA